MKRKRKKVLIICGGGVYGVIPAAFMSMLPKEKQTLKDVDLLSGCSIGGMLAAVYATGRDFTGVLEDFQKYASQCFTKRFVARINPIACPTYDSESLNRVLINMLGNWKMGEVKKDAYPDLDVVIPALNLTDDAYKVFDNITDRDSNMLLRTIAAMTSAAPSYFSGVPMGGKCYVDGGIIEVAPLLTATTALKGKRGVPFADMDVLMLGTGKDIDKKPITPERYDGFNLLDVALNVVVPYVTLSNEMATRYWGKNMGYHSFEYFNPCVTDGTLDDITKIPQAVASTEVYREQFLAAWDQWLTC